MTRDEALAMECGHALGERPVEIVPGPPARGWPGAVRAGMGGFPDAGPDAPGGS
ncbi:MAG: hypothetical protein M3408_06575 [Actinomycetota bacterium]|nr:hypothetical protein [Actinomycetota bacterium]